MGQGVEEGHVGASDSGVRDPGKESRDGEEPGSHRYIITGFHHTYGA